MVDIDSVRDVHIENRSVGSVDYDAISAVFVISGDPDTAYQLMLHFGDVQRIDKQVVIPESGETRVRVETSYGAFLNWTPGDSVEAKIIQLGADGEGVQYVDLTEAFARAREPSDADVAERLSGLERRVRNLESKHDSIDG